MGKEKGRVADLMDEDKAVTQITEIFVQARGLLRCRLVGTGKLDLDPAAMDVLLDHTLQLGPEGLANVLMILTLDWDGTRPIKRRQAEAAVHAQLMAEAMRRDKDDA